MDLYFRISTSRFKNLAEEIVSIFPAEHTAVYYAPYTNEDGKVRSARGKLYNSYIYLKKKYKKYGVETVSKPHQSIGK